MACFSAAWSTCGEACLGASAKQNRRGLSEQTIGYQPGGKAAERGGPLESGGSAHVTGHRSQVTVRVEEADDDAVALS